MQVARRIIIALGLLSFAYMMVVVGMHAHREYANNTRHVPQPVSTTRQWTPPACDSVVPTNTYQDCPNPSPAASDQQQG